MGQSGENTSKKTQAPRVQSASQRDTRYSNEQHFAHDGGDHLGSSRANRVADRKFPLSSLKFSQHQTRDIGYSDQEKQSNYGENKDQGVAILADARFFQVTDE